MSSSGAVDGTSVSHYLHPDFLEPLPASLDPKQNPLVLLAQTCNNIGKDVSYAHSKKAGSIKSGDARLSTPPKLVSLKADEDKQPSSTSTEQRHSPTSTRSPKYAQTPEQAKSAPDGKALSPALLRDAAHVKSAPLSDDKATLSASRCSLRGESRSTPVGGGASPAMASGPREKASPCCAGDSKSPSSSQEAAAGQVGSSSFPFPLPHPALLSAAYSAAMPWPTLPFPHLAAAAASLPGLSCPCGQCSLGSPGSAAPSAAPPSGPCAATGATHCSCAHCLAHPSAPQAPHSLMHDSFSSACFYSGLLNSYLGHHNGNGASAPPGAAPNVKAVAAAAVAAAAAASVSPGASGPTSSAPTSCATSTSATAAASSRTVEYCMYCGKHCPSPEQLLAHLQCHMSTNDSVSPPAPTAAAPGLGLYSSSAAADLIRKLYASSAAAAAAGSTSSAAAAGLSPRFHPYRSFLPKLSPHRAPFQPFGAPLV